MFMKNLKMPRWQDHLTLHHLYNLPTIMELKRSLILQSSSNHWCTAALSGSALVVFITFVSWRQSLLASWKKFTMPLKRTSLLMWFSKASTRLILRVAPQDKKVVIIKVMNLLNELLTMKWKTIHLKSLRKLMPHLSQRLSQNKITIGRINPELRHRSRYRLISQ
jgi:hypothetical protein